jgi:hypothetical protein
VFSQSASTKGGSGPLEICPGGTKPRIHGRRIHPERLPDLAGRHLLELGEHEDRPLVVIERLEQLIDDARSLGSRQRPFGVSGRRRVGDPQKLVFVCRALTVTRPSAAPQVAGSSAAASVGGPARPGAGCRTATFAPRRTPRTPRAGDAPPGKTCCSASSAADGSSPSLRMLRHTKSACSSYTCSNAGRGAGACRARFRSTGLLAHGVKAEGGAGRAGRGWGVRAIRGHAGVE